MDEQRIKVVGRSGCVMDLPAQLARSLLRDGTVQLVEPDPDPPAKKATRKKSTPKPADDE